MTEPTPTDVLVALTHDQPGEARELGVRVYASPTSLDQHGQSPPAEAYEAISAAAAVELMRSAQTTVCL